MDAAEPHNSDPELPSRAGRAFDCSFDGDLQHADCDDVRPPIDITALARERKVIALDNRIGLLSAQIHSLEAELVASIAEHDQLQGWQSGDFRTHSTWISPEVIQPRLRLSSQGLCPCCS